MLRGKQKECHAMYEDEYDGGMQRAGIWIEVMLEEKPKEEET